MAIEVATRDGGTTSLDSSRLDELDARFAGPVLRPGDRGWDEIVGAGDGPLPALVLQPCSARDLEAAIDFAHDNRLVLNVMGSSDPSGAVALDLSRLRSA